MNDTQFQIDHLIELAVLQRAELKQLVDSMPQLRDHLSEEIERNLEEAEPAIRSELEQLVIARTSDEHAKISVALTAKIDELAKALEITTAAKYSVLMAERAENANLLAKAEARIEDAASMLTHAVKEIVTDELSRFPRAGEIDQLRKEFAEPRGLNPRGRWMPDETYQRLDLVTINGDSFVSNIDGNRERPSRTAGDWTLSAARGNGGGGGGVTSMTDLVPVPSNGQLLIGNGSAFVNSTLTAGTGISISNGAGSITISATDGNITLDDGTAAAPSLNFTNEPTTGLFRASSNVMGFAVNGVSRATMTTTGVTVAGTITPTGSVHAAAGSVGNPSLAFNADQDTGLFAIGANNLGVAAGGAKVLDVATTGLGVTGTLSVSGVATLGAGAILNTPASGTATNLTGLPLTTGVTGTLPVANGGTGVTTSTGSGANVLATSPTLVTPLLGTPTSATLTNATGLPISTGVSGLGTGVATFLATPSSANLASAVTDETGTGALVFATSPTLTTPISATLTSPASTNLTLAGGAGNSSIILTPAGTGNVGIGTTLPQSDAGYGGLSINGSNGSILTFKVGDTSKGRIYVSGSTINIDANAATNDGIVYVRTGSSSTVRATIDATAAAFAGAVTVASSTAGSASAGALVVTGGLAAGAASYFGGAVSVVTGNGTGAQTSKIQGGSSGGDYGILNFQNGATVKGRIVAGAGETSFRFDTNGTTNTIDFLTGTGYTTALSISGTTQAATFGGTVTAAGTITQVGATSGYVWYKDSTPTKAWGLGSNGFAGLTTGDGDFSIATYSGSAWSQRLVVANATGAATFAGAVTVGGNFIGGGTANQFNAASAELKIGTHTNTTTSPILSMSTGGVGGNSNLIKFFTGGSDLNAQIKNPVSSQTLEIYAASTLAATFATTGTTFGGAVSVSGTTATWTSGTGSPESVKTAPVGSLYSRTDGGASTTLYVKESGAGNTGWIAK